MIETAAVIIILFLSIVLHEYAHGIIAHTLGDPTPQTAGRLTFNPLRHIDFFGTILLPTMIIIVGGGRIPPVGYAKPMPINPYNFKNPRIDMLWVSLGGPASNLAAAAILVLLRKIAGCAGIAEIIAFAITINIILCLFNLIPIPPLDGSRIVAAFLSPRNAWRYLKMSRIGFIVIFGLVLTGILQRTILPLLRFLLHLAGISDIIL